MPTTLMIEHIPGDTPTFVVRRLDDGKGSRLVQVPSPYGLGVEGRRNGDLMRELRWYLENFLEYPFEPETDHADRVLRALRNWGQQTFEALFASLDSGRLFHAAAANDYSCVSMQTLLASTSLLRIAVFAVTGVLVQPIQAGERDLAVVHELRRRVIFSECLASSTSPAAVGVRRTCRAQLCTLRYIVWGTLAPFCNTLIW
jgi:hypothetical protein